MLSNSKYHIVCLKTILVVLLVVTVAGFVHGIKASVAQMIHKAVRYDDKTASRNDPESASKYADKAHKLYPYNYYLCIWIAENCWYNRTDESGIVQSERVALADMWCQRGLELNQRKRELRFLAARLIAMESPADAVAYWKRYVDWHFWDVYNHVVLLEFYATSGNFEAALDELRWIEGSSLYKYANDLLNWAWKKEIMGMPEK